MDMKKLAMGIVAMVVAIVIVVTCAIPIISDSVATEDKFTNDGYFTMDKVSSDADFVLTWDYSKPNIIDISGTEVDMSTRDLKLNQTYTIFGADNFVLRYIYSTQPYVQYYGDQDTTPAFMQANIITSSKLTATVSNGSIVFATDNVSYPNPATITMSENTYCINPTNTGSFVMKKSNESVYVETNSTIIVLDGVTQLSANDVGIFATGTIDDNLDAQTFRGTTTYDVTFGDFTYTTTKVSNYIDLVKLEKVEFTATQNDTDYDVMYSYFIVPTEVTAERSVHVDGPTGDILGVIPVMMVLGIVIGAIALFIKSKRD